MVVGSSPTDSTCGVRTYFDSDKPPFLWYAVVDRLTGVTYEAAETAVAERMSASRAHTHPPHSIHARSYTHPLPFVSRARAHPPYLGSFA